MITDQLFIELDALQSNVDEHQTVMDMLAGDLATTTVSYQAALNANAAAVLAATPLTDTTPLQLRMNAIDHAIDIERPLLAASVLAVQAKKAQILRFDATAFN